MQKYFVTIVTSFTDSRSTDTWQGCRNVGKSEGVRQKFVCLFCLDTLCEGWVIVPIVMQMSFVAIVASFTDTQSTATSLQPKEPNQPDPTQSEFWPWGPNPTKEWVQIGFIWVYWIHYRVETEFEPYFRPTRPHWTHFFTLRANPTWLNPNIWVQNYVQSEKTGWVWPHYTWQPVIGMAVSGFKIQRSGLEWGGVDKKSRFCSYSCKNGGWIVCPFAPLPPFSTALNTAKQASKHWSMPICSTAGLLCSQRIPINNKHI